MLWWILRGHWAAGLVLAALLMEVSRPAVVSAALALLAGTAMDRARIRRLPWRRIDLPLLAVAAAAAAFDMFLGRGDLLSSVSVLVLGIQAVKFLLPKTARDGWQLCAISYLEFLSAAASTSEIHFAVCVFLFLGLSAGAMWALQAESAAENEGGAVPRAPMRFAVKLLAFSSCAGFLATALLFAVTPRIGIGQFLRRPGGPQGIAGFSDTISLRGVTGIKLDRRVVARVEFPALAAGLSPPDLYLRGTAYTVFDGFVWRSPEARGRPVPRSGPFYHVAARPARPSLSTADIALEPMETPVLFVYGSPVAIEGNLGEIRSDERGSFRFPDGARQAIRYRLHFDAGADAGAAAYSRDDLSLPDGWDELSTLAAGITEAGKSDAERAELALRYFRTGYQYSIDDPAPTLRHFLAGKKQGYCEHFATALCLVLRAAGIPSRVAAGFLGGEWSEVGKYLIVRQSDAHAWTEGWIGGRWTILDATPPLGDRSPFFARTGTVGIYLDWIRQRWNKYVVNYSLRMQAEGLSEGIAAASSAQAGIMKILGGEGFPAGRSGWIAVAFLAAIAAAAIGKRLLSGRSGGWGRTARGEAPLPRRYAKLVRRLSARGFRRSRGSTLEEMVLEAAAARPSLRGTAERLVALYHRDRFGPIPLSPGEVRESSLLAERFGRAILTSEAS
jgi:transglutaminase-like putative cysteine protease